MAKKQKKDKITKSVEILVNTGNFESIRVATGIEREVEYSDQEELDQQKKDLYSEVLDSAKEDVVQTLEEIGKEHAISNIIIKTKQNKAAPKELFEDSEKESEENDDEESKDSEDGDDDLFANMPPTPVKKKTVKKEEADLDHIFSDSKLTDKYAPDEGIEEPTGLDSIVQQVASSAKATINKKV